MTNTKVFSLAFPSKNTPKDADSLLLEVHVLVRLKHVLALVALGTAECHHEETELLLALFFHRRVGKVTVDEGVRKHLVLKERFFFPGGVFDL